jgi:hypothetical protein
MVRPAEQRARARVIVTRHEMVRLQVLRLGAAHAVDDGSALPAEEFYDGRAEASLCAPVALALPARAASCVALMVGAPAALDCAFRAAVLRACARETRAAGRHRLRVTRMTCRPGNFCRADIKAGVLRLCSSSTSAVPPSAKVTTHVSRVACCLSGLSAPSKGTG